MKNIVRKLVSRARLRGGKPTPSVEGRPRVLYFINQYPLWSEGYVQEEIRSLVDEWDIGVVSLRRSKRPRRESFPHKVIRYRDPCMVFKPFEQINRDFNSENQLQFLAKADKFIAKFQPHVLHCHWLGLVLLLEHLAKRHSIPFTVRTHSMDVLNEPEEKLEALCSASNSPWCLKVLAFPGNSERLIARGLNPDKVVECWPVVNYDRFHKPDKRPRTGRILCEGPAIKKKAHRDFVDLAVKMKGSDLSFDLYAAGPYLKKTIIYNAEEGDVVSIKHADPDDMPDIYPRYDWLIYPADLERNKVGLPVGIAEAQAAGLGVCWQELPGRREEQLAYLDGAGFLFNSIDEVPDIISRPYPEEMRLRGFVAAKKSDIQEHKTVLSDAWKHGLSLPGATSG